MIEDTEYICYDCNLCQKWSYKKFAKMLMQVDGYSKRQAQEITNRHIAYYGERNGYLRVCVRIKESPIPTSFDEKVCSRFEPNKKAGEYYND